MPDKLQNLYDTFVADGYEMEPFEDFKNNLKDAKKRRAAYDALVNDGYDMEDYSAFEKNIGMGEVPASSPATPATIAASEPIEPSADYKEAMDNPALNPFAFKPERSEATAYNASGEPVFAKGRKEAPAVARKPKVAEAAEEAPAIQGSPSNPYMGMDYKELEKLAQDPSVMPSPEDSAFVADYENKLNELRSADDYLDTGDYDAWSRANGYSAFITANEDRYRKAKARVETAAQIQGAMNLSPEGKANVERMKELRNEYRDRYISAGPENVPPGYFPDSYSKEDNKFKLAAGLMDEALQVANMGSKYAPGYDGEWYEKAGEAVKQFGLAAAGNVNINTLTAGLASGMSHIEARKAGDKANKIAEQAVKEASKDFDIKNPESLAENLQELSEKLQGYADELEPLAATLESMGKTYEEMAQNGASQQELDKYYAEYKKKYLEYGEKYNDYQTSYSIYERHKGDYDKLQDAVDAALEKGLSEGDKALLDALGELTDIQAKRSLDTSVAANAGLAAEQSAEFMLDFILTGGLSKGGAKLSTKIATGAIRRRLGKTAVRGGLTNIADDVPAALAKLSARGIKPNIGARMLSDVAVAAERTALMFPRNLKAYGDALTEMAPAEATGIENPSANMQFSRGWVNAGINTAITQYIEYWSEGFGEYFGAAESALWKNATKRAPITAIGKTLKDYRGSIGRYLDNGKFDGMFNEMLEEVVGSLFNSAAGWLSGDRVGDSDAIKDFASGEQLSTLFFSFLPMSMFSAGTNLKAYSKMRDRYNEAVATLQPLMESGAVSSEDLDALVSHIEAASPKELKERVVAIADKARAKNGRRLPENFAQSLMGYVEGSLSMQMEGDVWRDSAEKAQVAQAYAEQYGAPVSLNAWDAMHSEALANNAALKAGFSQDELDKDPYRMAQDALAMKETDPERSALLLALATAKAQRMGLEDGYEEETNAMAQKASDDIAQVSNNGSVIYANLPTGEQVIVTSKDASVENGKVVVNGGDGVVTVTPAAGAPEQSVKSSELTGAITKLAADLEGETLKNLYARRKKEYNYYQNRISVSGKRSAVGERVGQTVYISDNSGVYEPVTIVRSTQDGDGVVITGDKEVLSGVAALMGMNVPKGRNLEVPSHALYDYLAKDEDGSISTEQPKEGTTTARPQAAPPAAPKAQPVAPAAPKPQPATATPEGAPAISELQGNTYTISYNGLPSVDVEVTGVDERNGTVSVNYKDAEGNDIAAPEGAPLKFSYNDFLAAMESQPAEAPSQAETPVAAPAAPAQPATSTEAPQVAAEEPQPEAPKADTFDGLSTDEWLQVTVPAMYAEEMSEDERSEFVSQLEADLSETQEKKEELEAKRESDKPKMTTDIAAYQQAKKELREKYDEQIAAVQKDIDEKERRLEGVRGALSEINTRYMPFTPTGVKTEFSQEELEPHNPEEAAAKFISDQLRIGKKNGKPFYIDTKSFKEETGFKGETKSFFMLFKKGGVTIGRLAEDLADAYPALFGGGVNANQIEGTAMQWDDQAARDAILSLFGEVRNTTDINNYILNNRKAHAAREAARQNDEIIHIMEERFGMPIEEYESQREAMIRADLEEMLTFPIEGADFLTNLREYYKEKFDYVGPENSQGNQVEDAGDESGAAEPVSDGGGEVLPGAQSVGGEGQESVGGDTGSAESTGADTGAGDGAPQGGRGLQAPVAEEETEEAPEEPVSEETEEAEEPSVGTLTDEDIIEIYNGRESTKEADKGKPGRKEIIEALYQANPQLVQFRNALDKQNAISDVIELAQKYPNLAISKIILGKVGETTAETPENKPEEGRKSGENSVSSEESSTEGKKPTTAKEARAYFEKLYGKGKKADSAVRVWELTHKKPSSTGSRGDVNRMAAVQIQPALSEAEAAELEQNGIMLAVDLITEDGYTKFPAFFKQVVELFEDGIRPFAKAIYMGAKAKVSREVRAQMDSEDAVYDFDERIDINDIDNGENNADIRQGESGEPDTAVPDNPEAGVPEGGNTSDGGSESGGAGGNGEASGSPEGGDVEQGQPGENAETNGDSGASDNVPGNAGGVGSGAGNNGGRTGGSNRRSGRRGKSAEGGTLFEPPVSEVEETAEEEGPSAEEKAAKEEQAAYEKEKAALKEESDTNKLKERRDTLRSKIDAIADKVDVARARLTGQLRAVLERLRELFASSAKKAEQLSQEKVLYHSVADPSGMHDIGNTVVPSGVGDAMREALKRVEAEIGKPIAEFVREELKYKTTDEMFSNAEAGKLDGLSGEQVDALGLAIYQMKTGKMMIVGDMTGIGKGRVAAGLIRWGKLNGKKVLFVTQKDDLLTAMYHDLEDIGSKGMIPWVVNKSNIEDEEDDGSKTTYVRHPSDNAAEALYKSGKDTLPLVEKGKDKGKRYDFVMATYSQFTSGTEEHEGDSDRVKRNNELQQKGRARSRWIQQYAKDAIVIMDESHTAGGNSSTGTYFQSLVKNAAGVTFLSATYAKRPENMVLYALRSSMGQAMVSQQQMIEAVKNYGVPMQEMLAAAFFETGEMVRRERDSNGMKTHWLVPTEIYTKEEFDRCRELNDGAVEVIRNIIDFQRERVNPIINKMNEDLAESNKAKLDALVFGSADDAYITTYSSTQYSSQVSNVVNILLLAIKARKAADMAIEQMERGEKPIIAIDNTLENEIASLKKSLGEDEEISPDFGMVFKRGLAFAQRYQKVTEHYKAYEDPDTGERKLKKLPEDRKVEKYDSIASKFGEEASAHKQALLEEVEKYGKEMLEMGLSLSPIDEMRQRIAEAGYSVEEITGRKEHFVQDADGKWSIQPLKNRKKAFMKRFNGGTLDCLILNRAGSTGISLHAGKKFADQKPRKMIIVQAAKDVNDEVQVRGRIDRTGQVSRGEYFYLTSPIPVEKRFMMNLRSKLASLDANAAGTENVSTNRVEVDDMQNKYGDEVAKEFLADHEEINNQLDRPIQRKKNKKTGQEEWVGRPDLMSDLLIGLQRMTCAEQEMALQELEERFADKIEYLDQNGINDLSSTTMNLEAETVDEAIMIKGRDNNAVSVFAHDTRVERVEVNNLKKPMLSAEIRKRMKSLGSLTADDKVNTEYGSEISAKARQAVTDILAEKKAKYDAQVAELEAKLRADHPKMDSMSQETYDNFIHNNVELATLRNKNSEAYDRDNVRLQQQLREVSHATTYLKPGLPCFVPLNESEHSQSMYGRFLGFETGKDGRPNSVKAMFATKDARGLVTIPVVSMSSVIHRITSSSAGFTDILGHLNSDYASLEEQLEARDKWWDKMIPKSNRAIRYMITGNVLQAIDSLTAQRGTITTFTRRDPETGEITIDRGLLLAEDFEPENFVVRTRITKDDIWNSPNEFEDDTAHIAVHREGSYMVVKFKRTDRRQKLSSLPVMSDDGFKALCIDGEVQSYGSDEIRGIVAEEKVEEALDYLYNNYGFTQSSFLVLPDSTDRPDRIVYTNRPFREVIDELKSKYKVYSFRDANSKLKEQMQLYKMDIENEDVKNTIRELVQLRQAYIREDYCNVSDSQLAWSAVGKEEEFEKYSKTVPGETPDEAKARRDRKDSALMEAEAFKEELAFRGFKKGHLLHFKQGQIELDEAIKTFNELNKDQENARIAKKVFAIVKKLPNFSVFMNEKVTLDTGGATAGNMVYYNWKFMNNDWVPDQLKANTILHELAHTCTVYAHNLALVLNNDVILPSEVVDVITELQTIWRTIRSNDVFFHKTGEYSWNGYKDYGTTNVKEMMAEAASNQEFRDHLAQVKLGISARSGVISFSDVTKSADYTGKSQNALEAVMERLEIMFDQFSPKAYEEAWRGTGYGSLSYMERVVEQEKTDKFNDLGREMDETRHLEHKAFLSRQQEEVLHTMEDDTVRELQEQHPDDLVVNKEMRDRELATKAQKEALARFDESDETNTSPSPVSSLANSVVVGRAIDNLGDKLHVKVNKVTREQMPKGHQNEKGYFDPRTREVYVCTENVASVDDAIATVMHEAVAHLGLRRLLGDQFPETMRSIYEALDRETRRRVNASMSANGWDAITAMEEYMAGLAEKEAENFTQEEKNLWQKIKDIFQNVLAVLTGRKTNLTDNDLRYILRASYENLRNPRYMETVQGWAKDLAMKSDLKVNDYVEPEYLFRTPTFEAGSNSIKNYEDALAETWQVIQMEHQDAQQSVRIAINAIQAETGNKPIGEDEDYIAKENLASSIAQAEQDEFLLFQVKPILEAVRTIQQKLHGAGKMNAKQQKAAYNEIITYLYAKHGAERNRYSNTELAKQEAEADAAKMAAEGKHLTNIERKQYEPKDWSGLTSLFGLEKTEHEEAERLADDLVAQFEGRVGQTEVDALWDAIRAATDYNLKHALDHGLLTRTEYDKLHGNESAGIPRMWEYYVPLRGFKEDTAEDRYNYSNITHQQANTVVTKKYKGRTSLAEDPIANLVNIGETEIAQGNSNLAKIALYKFALNRSDNKLLTARDVWYEKQADGKWMAAEPRPGETLEEFENRMQMERQNGLARVGRRGLSLDMIMANTGHKAEHLIRLKINGSERAIWVNGDPALARAVAGSLRAQNMKAIRAATRTLSNLFTSYSIDFTARNLFRDMLYSRMRLMAMNDPKYLAQYRKNWWNNFGYSPLNVPMVRLISQWQSGKLQQKANPTERERLFMDFMRDGGATGYTITNSVDRIKKDIMKQIANGGRGERSTVSKVLGFYPRAVQALNEAYELLTRFTAYETSRQLGRSGQTSASDAKEISVNFNRKGAQTGRGFWGVTAAFMGATHYFYNAGVQGFQNFMNLYKNHPYRMGAMTGGLMVAGFMTPFINALLAAFSPDGDDDDWYWTLPQWVRRNNIVIGWKGTYIAIPLAVEQRAIYGLGDIIAAFADRKVADKDFWSVAFDVMNQAGGILPINPVEDYTSSGNVGDAVLRTVMPDATMVFLDWATNRDYTGRPLAKENPYNNTTPNVYGAYTSTPSGIVKACEVLAKKTGIDLKPGYVRDAFKQYGGGIYSAFEEASKFATGVIDPDKPMRVGDVPFVSGFVGHIDEDRTDSFVRDALYDYKTNMENVIKRIKTAAGDKDGDLTPKVIFEGEMPEGSASVQRIYEGRKYELAKMYREGMNGPEGVTKLRKAWNDAKEEYAKMPKKTTEEKQARAEQRLAVQDAWQKYYDAECDLVDRLLNYEAEGAPLSERIIKSITR